VQNERDPGRVLARRLRALREQRWSNIKITQPQLAEALGGARPLSVPLISSWESQTRPKIPPVPRLEAYATFFATPRSVRRGRLQLLALADLTDSERREREELRQELMRLRNEALRAVGGPGTDATSVVLGSGPWHFNDGRPITIICAQLPAELPDRMPYLDPADPDYSALHGYADLDALFELHGHIRAANPASQVSLRTVRQLAPDDYTTHLVSLGRVDWNPATRLLLDRLRLPVRQVADEGSPDGRCFEVAEGGQDHRHRPSLEQVGERTVLRQDVALFARGANPYNKERTVTICNGMHVGGTYGMVRSLTDTRFRDQNAEYLRAHFAGQEIFCILSRVTILSGVALTPDWTVAENRLFEWAGPQTNGRAVNGPLT
jgi:transcriptional regulator with XRE-family HTH domain